MTTKYRTHLRRRQVAEVPLQTASLHPLLSRLYAHRGVSQLAELERGARFLHPFQGLDGVEQAAGNPATGAGGRTPHYGGGRFLMPMAPPAPR